MSNTTPTLRTLFALGSSTVRPLATTQRSPPSGHHAKFPFKRDPGLMRVLGLINDSNPIVGMNAVYDVRESEHLVLAETKQRT